MKELVLKGIGGQCPTPVTIFGETPDARGLALSVGAASLRVAMPLACTLTGKQDTRSVSQTLLNASAFPFGRKEGFTLRYRF
ncbi:hypothetical protein [Nostoc sp.]|uniref:hypothetical protein n=1 Tax=Nostoc sp. TaxID=1180 RepID=UPI002FFC6760